MFDKSKVGQSFPPFTIEVERGEDPRTRPRHWRHKPYLS